MAGRLFIVSLFCVGSLFAITSTTTHAGELVKLRPDTWDTYAPQGKEVDAIYGDHVLRNDKIVAVIAQAIDGRRANLTVHEIAGCLIDLTRRDRQSDQLSAFYPYARRAPYRRQLMIGTDRPRSTTQPHKDKPVATAKRLIAEVRNNPGENGLLVVTTYILEDGWEWIECNTTFTNNGEKAVTVDLVDSMRADRTFEHGQDGKLNMHWVYDRWFNQAYGFVSKDFKVAPGPAGRGGVPGSVYYEKDGKRKVTLGANESIELTRIIIPGNDVLQVKGIAGTMLKYEQGHVQLSANDDAGPVANANVIITRQGEKSLYARGRTDAQGNLPFLLPKGEWHAAVSATGRAKVETTFNVTGTENKDNAVAVNAKLPNAGYVVGHITDAQGRPIPCKVQFIGKDGTRDPYFFHDSGTDAVVNLVYTPNGQFTQEIHPGKFDVTISYGPEYDAIFTTINVKAGQVTRLTGKLIRTVKTPGWVSAEYHSHSSPSGDNTSSQRGRVLNLVCEHLEFAPCTEHQRIDSYIPVLKRLGVEHLMATCSGMELTGRPGDVNHQNAFPLIHKPHTQDGGAPHVHNDPRVQFQRLAYWDDKSEKLVQQNHPNIRKVFMDKNLDGKADGGFGTPEFMDVIEIHPPANILAAPRKGNRMFEWMQMLNQGYRIPGVVNTDAHYNFHGSGWLRNWIKSSTDDPAKIDTMEMVRNSEKGNIIMSTGPYMEVNAYAASITDKVRKPGKNVIATAGEDISSFDGKVRLRVKVQCPNWFDINRVQVFVNGVPDKRLNYTRKTHADHFGNGVVKYDRMINIELTKDAHLIVAAAGEGLTLGKVYGNSRGKLMPIAVSNPIFVDVDGGGFKANGDDLGVALPKE